MARILVVDDNVDSAESLAMLLRLSGHEVAVAHDGPDGLDCAQRFAPEVLMLDIGLPGMDGYELARQVHRLPQTGQATLIALTGYGRDEDRRRALAAGFDHHLVKPVEFEQLQALLAVQRAPADGEGVQ